MNDGSERALRLAAASPVIVSEKAVPTFALSQMRAAQGSREDEDALKPFEEQMKYRVAPHGVSDPPKP